MAQSMAQSMKQYMQSRQAKPTSVGPTMKASIGPSGKISAPKVLPPEQHMNAATDHLSAARLVQEHDHVSAADHLMKAGVHAGAAAQHFQANSEKWIQKAIKHPGAFTAQAKKAGKSVSAYAAQVTKPDPRRAQLRSVELI